MYDNGEVVINIVLKHPFPEAMERVAAGFLHKRAVLDWRQTSLDIIIPKDVMPVDLPPNRDNDDA